MRLNSTGLGIGTNAPAAQSLEIANAPISAAWGTNGLGLRVDAETLTDSNSPTGTVTYNMANTIGVPTLTTVSNTVTYTNAATLYIAGQRRQGDMRAQFVRHYKIGRLVEAGQLLSTLGLSIANPGFCENVFDRSTRGCLRPGR